MDSGGGLIGTVSSTLSIQKRELTGMDVSETIHPEEEEMEAPGGKVQGSDGCVGGTGLFRKRGTMQSTQRNEYSVCLCVEIGFNCVFFVQMLLLIFIS